MDIVASRAQSLLSIDINNVSGSQIEELEDFIRECNDSITSSDGVLVANAVYDQLVDILKVVRPESELLSHLWDEPLNLPILDSTASDMESLDHHVYQNPMLSITTVKDRDSAEFKSFTSTVSRAVEELGGLSLFVSMKIDGHGIRVVYKDGHFVKATSRARSSAGEDISHVVRYVVPEFIEDIADFGVVEIRGELCVSDDGLEGARKAFPDRRLKNHLSAVTSLKSPSSGEVEAGFLKFLAYKYFDDSGAYYQYRAEQYSYLMELGFDVPEFFTAEVVPGDDVSAVFDSVLGAMSKKHESYPFLTDGIVVEFDSLSLVEQLGTSFSAPLSSVALKIGVWEQKTYEGYVQCLYFKPGKTKLTPVAIVATEPGLARFSGEAIDIARDYGDKSLSVSESYVPFVFDTSHITNYQDIGVPVADGSVVRNVAVYNVAALQSLGAVPGEVLHFLYGGRAGIVPCDSHGRLLKDVPVSFILDEAEVGTDFSEDFDLGEE